LIYRFGPFALDSLARRLTRDGVVVSLADRHVDVLLRLLARPGEVVGKEALVQAAWGDVAVTDNSLEQAISMLRKAIAAEGPPKGGHHEREADHHAIETVPRRGYRFAGTVARETSKQSDEELEALLAPHRAWLEGRAALETLSVQKVGGAERAFRSVLEAAPDHASAHVGLANALVFRFEATRIDEQPDVAALTAAVPHARDACRLQPEWAEAWATLGFVLHRGGQFDHGIAAARRAVDLEPDNWRHHLRLAFVCWGEARLRAAQRTLQLMPGLALAHWLAASVHIARQAFEAADRELTAGAAAQDEQVEGAMFGGIGLHWVSGLLRLAQGDSEEAERHFDRELAFEHSGHLYARECSAATWYAKGAHAFHDDDRKAADHAFDEVLRRVPRHPFALAARFDQLDSGVDEFGNRLALAATRGALVDVSVAQAVRQAARAQDPDVAAVHSALQQVPAGASGWYLPVEPMLRPFADQPRWASTLALLRSRAG
jgi:DNA-binding winged helix-turn-helix (wHTH) protein